MHGMKNLDGLLENCESARIYFGSLPDYIQGAVIRNADRITDEEELHRFSDTVRRELK